MKVKKYKRKFSPIGEQYEMSDQHKDVWLAYGYVGILIPADTYVDLEYIFFEHNLRINQSGWKEHSREGLEAICDILVRFDFVESIYDNEEEDIKPEKSDEAECDIRVLFSIDKIRSLDDEELEYVQSIISRVRQERFQKIYKEIIEKPIEEIKALIKDAKIHLKGDS